MADLNIYRAGAIVATVSIDEKTVLQTKLMNEDVVISEFVTSAVLPLAIGDYITFAGKFYYMNNLPTIVKKNTGTFKYSAAFQSELYDLNQKLLISSDGLTDFTYAADPLGALALIVSNMNENFAGWTVGDVDPGDVQVIAFFNETCRMALGKIAEVFAFEYEVIGKTINFKKAIGTVKNYTFQYGQGAGLYEIERRQVENKNVFTRVYGYGGTKNIPYTYRDRAKRLVFEERFLEKNTAIYGIKEGQFTDEEIYPKRTAPLTAVNIQFTDEGAYNVTDSYVEDTTLNFDINDYLLEGSVAKIVFKSGALSGYQFDIWKYDHDTKRIYFNPFSESDGYVLPSATSGPAVGDKYTLVDIKMPGIYVIEAEQALKAATQRFIDENSVPKMIYIVKMDPKYAKANLIDISAGDLVKVVDVQLGISRSIRISSLSFPLCNPYKMTAVIADFIPFTLQQLTQRNQSRQEAQLRTVVTNITNTVNNNDYSYRGTQVINNYGAEYPEEDVVIINGRKFNFTKAVYNTLNPRILEPGDIISDQFWDDETYVVEWRFKGGDMTDRDNYFEVQTIDASEPVMLMALNKLQVKLLTETDEPDYLATVDEHGVFGKFPYKVAGNFRPLYDRLQADDEVADAYVINWEIGETWRITMIGDTVFEQANLPEENCTKTITLHIDGDFTPTWPVGWDAQQTGYYDGSSLNTVVVEYVDQDLIKVQISQKD